MEEKTLEKNIEEINEEKYNNILKIDNSGIMGYLRIEKINVNLPIYHGTQETTLKNGIGHLAGSSMPSASKNSHIVLAGHTGLSSAQLLSNLDKLQNEDDFEINVLNYTYKYKVNQIKKVLPDKLDDLNIEENKQYATLVTCTPYGINSHRLLVRGELYDIVSISEDIQIEENSEILLKEKKLNIAIIIICSVIVLAIGIIMYVIKIK